MTPSELLKDWLEIAQPRRRALRLGRLLDKLQNDPRTARAIRSFEGEADAAAAELSSQDAQICERLATLWKSSGEDLRERLASAMEDDSFHAYWPFQTYEESLCSGEVTEFPTSIPRGVPPERTKKLVMALAHWVTWAVQIAPKGEVPEALLSLQGESNRLERLRENWEREFEIARQSLPGNAYRRLRAGAEDLAPVPPTVDGDLVEWAEFMNADKFAHAVLEDDAEEIDHSSIATVHEAIEADVRLLCQELRVRVVQREGTMRKVKILVLAADPTDESKLRLGEEVRAIGEKVRGADRRDGIEIVQQWAVRPDDLLQSLNEHQPDIVHFCGHGSSEAISVVGSDGGEKRVTNAALVALFKTLRDNIRVVVLNSCYSQTQAEAIAEVIDFAVGMSRRVGDDAAIVFAASFYRAVAFGKSVKEAFDQGKVALLVEGIPEEDVPVLLARSGTDPATTVLVGTEDHLDA